MCTFCMYVCVVCVPSVCVPSRYTYVLVFYIVPSYCTFVYIFMCVYVHMKLHMYVCTVPYINLYTHHTFVCFGCFLVNIYFFLFASLRFNLFNPLIFEHSISMAEKLKWQYSSYFKPCIVNVGWNPHIA